MTWHEQAHGTTLTPASYQEVRRYGRERGMSPEVQAWLRESAYVDTQAWAVLNSRAVLCFFQSFDTCAMPLYRSCRSRGRMATRTLCV